MSGKDAYWFHHDSNAFQDPKIARLFRLHGLAGYGLFWVVIERLREAREYRIKCDSIQDLVYQVRTTEDAFNALFDCGLIERDCENYFFSPSLNRRMERWNAKRETLKVNGSKGGVANAKQMLSKSLANAKQTSSKRVAIREEKRREDEIREEQIRKEEDSFPDAAEAAPEHVEKRSRKKAATKEPDMLIDAKRSTWEAYSNAYGRRYGIEPILNAKQNSIIKSIVSRIPAEDAPDVVAYYVMSHNSYYIAKGHSLQVFLADCEKLRTEWATGRQMTQTQARQNDTTFSRIQAIAEAASRSEDEKRISQRISDNSGNMQLEPFSGGVESGS